MTGDGDWKDTQSDPEVGELKFVLKSWEDAGPIKMKELASRICTEDDFLVKGEDEKSSYGFYPIH